MGARKFNAEIEKSDSRPKTIFEVSIEKRFFKQSGFDVSINIIRFFNPLFLSLFFLMWITDAFRVSISEKSLSKGLGALWNELTLLLTPNRKRADLPIIIQPKHKEFANHTSLAKYINQHQKELIGLMDQYGGILFRGFNLETTDQAIPALRNLKLVPTQYGSNTGTVFRPRLDEYFHRDRRVCGAETKVPFHKRILGGLCDFLGISWGTPWGSAAHFGYHSEAAYSLCPAGQETPFPSHISWLCTEAPNTGGKTVISDNRKVLKRIRDGILKKDNYVGLFHVDRYKPMGVNAKPWDPVKRYKSPDTLSPSELKNHTCPIVSKHPRTQAASFANHLVHDGMFLSSRYFIDGTQLSTMDYFHILKAHVLETTYFSWQKGDLLVLDNVLASHSGTAFNAGLGKTRELRVATMKLED